MEVKVISSDLDGAELRREKRFGRHVVCDGRDDAPSINDAIRTVPRGRYWTGLGDAYERIFGRK